MYLHRSVLFILAASHSVVNAFLPSPIKQNNVLWGSKSSRRKHLAIREPEPALADSTCEHGPYTRACWSNGFSIAADFDNKWPETGVVRSYYFDISNTTCNPDGYRERACLLINGQYPGPTIIADWGDTISVQVKNSMAHNGTGIHWHGIRQLYNVMMDGVPGVTECPIPPGATRTYTFRATQYGSTWYHSHFSSQYGDGVLGSILINGPAASNYDIDLGMYPVSDWYYLPAEQADAISRQNLQIGKPPPPADTILINGLNKNPAGGGRYSNVVLKRGKKHRLRIVNTSMENNIRFSLDGHPFTVIALDLVPIHTYTADWILVAVGQRADVIIEAKADNGNYWFRAEVATDCGSANNFYGRAIFSYEGTPYADPSTQPDSPMPTVCTDEGPGEPWWNSTVPDTDFVNQIKDLQVDLNFGQVDGNGQNIVLWGVNTTSIDVNWDRPTIQYVLDQNDTYPHVYNLVELPVENIWTYWVIQETGGEGTLLPIPHPIHLHGHDFFILGKGVGVFNKDSDLANLNFHKPPRRDTTFLPARGWVVIAFPTDNPGAWLCHCHIAFHISSGLGVQFIEAKEQIKAPEQEWLNTCESWRGYWGEHSIYEKDDSGL